MGGDRATHPGVTAPPLVYFWGEDSFGLAHAADMYAAELAAEMGQPLDVWRTSADDDDAADSGNGSAGAGRKRARVLEQVEQRLGTGTLFSSGTLVVVRQPGSLLRETSAREQLIGLLDGVAPGNALCFLDLIASGGKGPAQAGVLRDAVAERGGRIQEFPALSRERMEGWIGTRAKEMNATLGPGAAHLLAERVGAYVREGDVDRRRQAELANGELEKLALYRPDSPISKEDIEALVAEAVPGSTWAFLDAVGLRRISHAATLARRLLDEATPMPVLITQVHRRLRDLILIREHIDAGTKPPDLIREMRLQPFRAQKLTEQARTWQQHELDQALVDLYDLDLLSKGIAPDGSPHSLSDGKSELAFLAFLGEHVGRTGGVARPTNSVGSAPVGTRR
jgi:DNA polymerase III delta subunit